MRRWRTPIEVQVDAGEQPLQYWWRGHRWRVQRVEQQWFESGPWWQGGRAAALSGAAGAGPDGDDDHSPAADPPVTDVLHEATVWRVEVVNGRPGSRSIHELSSNANGWVLRAVVD